MDRPGECSCERLGTFPKCPPQGILTIPALAVKMIFREIGTQCHYRREFQRSELNRDDSNTAALRRSATLSPSSRQRSSMACSNWGVHSCPSLLAGSSMPHSDAMPGTSGAAAEVSNRTLPCCRMAPRQRLWALPATLCPSSSTSPAADRRKQRNGSAVCGAATEPRSAIARPVARLRMPTNAACTARYNWPASRDSRCD